ncbi:hypothetical protein BJX70DRAFT_331199 [Aspergillus crustosus]
MDLIQRVGGLHNDLHTALLTLQLVVNIDNTARMASNQQSTAGVATVTRQTLQAADSLERRHDHSDKIMTEMLRKMEQMELTITHLRTTTKTLPDPATLRALLDDQKQITSAVTVTPFQRRTSSRFPRFPPNKRERTIQTRITVCNRFLTFWVQVSLNITTGAGGFAISPTLIFLALVSDSPAFRIVRETMMLHDDSWNDIQALREQKDGLMQMQEVHVKLVQVFQDGEASPHEIDPDGNTALHEAPGLLFWWQNPFRG